MEIPVLRITMYKMKIVMNGFNSRLKMTEVYSVYKLSKLNNREKEY